MNKNRLQQLTGLLAFSSLVLSACGSGGSDDRDKNKQLIEAVNAGRDNKGLVVPAPIATIEPTPNWNVTPIQGSGSGMFPQQP